jgi:hypothetical protein
MWSTQSHSSVHSLEQLNNTMTMAYLVINTSRRKTNEVPPHSITHLNDRFIGLNASVVPIANLLNLDTMLDSRILALCAAFLLRYFVFVTMYYKHSTSHADIMTKGINPNPSCLIPHYSWITSLQKWITDSAYNQKKCKSQFRFGLIDTQESASRTGNVFRGHILHTENVNHVTVFPLWSYQQITHSNVMLQIRSFYTLWSKLQFKRFTWRNYRLFYYQVYY